MNEQVAVTDVNLDDSKFYLWLIRKDDFTIALGMDGNYHYWTKDIGDLTIFLASEMHELFLKHGLGSLLSKVHTMIINNFTEEAIYLIKAVMVSGGLIDKDGKRISEPSLTRDELESKNEELLVNIKSVKDLLGK